MGGEWIAPTVAAVLATIVSIFGSWLTFRIRFERLESATAERVKNYLYWREIVDQAIDRLEQEGSPQLQTVTEEIDRRLDRIEERVFGIKRRR